MKWFLFFVVLNSLQKYTYGEEITMFVNVNDTVDLRVEKETQQGLLYSCKAQLYSDTKVLIKNYTLVEMIVWELNKNDKDVRMFFELLDYHKSCSFSISPFSVEFYGHWIVNTTTYIGEDKENLYSYKYQEFYLTIPPKENISYPKDYHSEDTNNTEKNGTNDVYCFDNNPISLRPRKVFGHVIKCLAIHYYKFHEKKNTEKLNSHTHNLEKKVHEIYPSTFHGFLFTGNDRSCQFKIIQMKFINPLCERWEIRTFYKNYQLTDEPSYQIDTFDIHKISMPKLPVRELTPIRGSAYIKIEKLNTVTNSTDSKFECQFNPRDGQTEKMKLPEYINSILPQDDFYRRIDYENDYAYFFYAKYHGNYNCTLHRKNIANKVYHFKTCKIYQDSIILFDGTLKEAWSRSCNDVLAIEGSMFLFWLTGYLPANIYKEKTQIIIEMPNGTLIGTYSTMLERNYLSRKVSIIDNGPWKLTYYNVLSKNSQYPEFTQFYSVTTWDSTRVKVIVDMSIDNSSISVYNIKENPKRCLFLSTNRTVIEESKPQVYNVKRLGCFIQNYEIDKLNECKFEMNQSLENNYGVKELSIDYGNFTINRTIILQRNFNGIKNYNKISDMKEKNSHFVKYNDEFLVNCSHNIPLLFCRIQAPTEKVTHITDKNSLKAGNCSMLVENANILDHNGTWKCQLAFNESNIGSTIIEYFFSVQVRNFYVRSSIEYIYENVETIIKQVVLHCEISNYIKSFKSDLIGSHEIDYCLWNHPNGSIIFKNSNKYTVNTITSFSCVLTIHSLYEEDLGNWSCNPHLKLLSNLNLYDTIHLIEVPRMFILKNYKITPELKRNITYTSHHQIASTGPGLDCHILPTVEADMISCKWTKINSNNINFTANEPDTGHYVPRKNNSVCELRFNYWEEYGDELDYGIWRCCVNITNSVDQTICRDIELPNEVYRPLKEGIGIYIFILVVILCLLVVFCSCFYFIIKKLKELLDKKKEKRRKSRRRRAASQRSRARSASQQRRARSSSHPRQPTSSLPSSQQDAQASRIMSAKIPAEPNIYV